MDLLASVHGPQGGTRVIRRTTRFRLQVGPGGHRRRHRAHRTPREWRFGLLRGNAKVFARGPWGDRVAKATFATPGVAKVAFATHLDHGSQPQRPRAKAPSSLPHAGHPTAASKHASHGLAPPRDERTRTGPHPTTATHLTHPSIEPRIATHDGPASVSRDRLASPPPELYQFGHSRPGIRHLWPMPHGVRLLPNRRQPRSAVARVDWVFADERTRAPQNRRRHARRDHP